MNWEEVCADPTLRDLPYKIELNQWGNIEMGPAWNRHGQIQSRIAYLLQLRKPSGVIITKCAIKTSKNVKVSDVAWISYARYNAAVTPDIVYTDTAPEICVEVILPSDNPEKLIQKRQLYLQAGAEEVWLCDESSHMRFFNADGPLERSMLCPEFPLRVELPDGSDA